jgi:plastocyanin
MVFKYVKILLVLVAGIVAGTMVLYVRDTVMPIDEVDLTHRAEISIVLTDQGFTPAHVRITAGTKIVFTSTREHEFWPASNPHPSHDIYPQLDPKQPIPSGQSWTFVANRVGIWGYHDHIRSYYTGVLDVVQ